MTEKQKAKLLAEYNSLSKGSVVRRRYAGGIRYSRQWRENGVTLSEQIAEDQVEALDGARARAEMSC